MYLDNAIALLIKPIITPAAAVASKIIGQWSLKYGNAYLSKELDKPSAEKAVPVNFGTNTFSIKATKPKLIKPETNP